MTASTTSRTTAVQVLAVSVDSVYAHKVWAERERVRLPAAVRLLAARRGGAGVRRLQRANGAANRGTFLIDRDGVIRFAEMNGPGEARDQDVWRRALAALADVA